MAGFMSIGRDALQEILEETGPGRTEIVREEQISPLSPMMPGGDGITGVDDPRRGRNISTMEYRYDQNGVAHGVGYNDRVFPSMGSGMDDERTGWRTFRSMRRAQRTYADHLALSDPKAAGLAYADLDSMTQGYESLIAGGWNPKDAAHAMGVAGQVFGGYSNLEQNAQYLKRYADTRGLDLATAGREFEGMRKNFGAQYLTTYGVTSKTGADSAHTENINNSFSDLLTAMRGVEDQYNWQFSRATYQDVMRRAARIAADLSVSGMSVSDFGADAIVRSALRQNGSLKDGGDDPLSGLYRTRGKDRTNLRLFSTDDPADSLGNPFRAEKGDPDTQDFGILRALRQSLFDHRARSIRAGLGHNDFSDTSTLRSEFADHLEAFSVNSSGVERRSFETIAYLIIAGIADGNATSVVDAARTLAESGTVSPQQAAALGRWSRGLTLGSPEAQRRAEEILAPKVAEYAARAGLSTRDPAVTQFSANLYKIVRRRFMDKETVAGLKEMEGEMKPSKANWDELASELDEYLGEGGVFSQIAAAKNQAAANRAKAVKAAKEEE